ncbi:hypothetical protein E3N88_23806 [Mikania micrantha]|uniref:Uncharacterized protein n=1 Tax=Mikania micrantha TaxID=192012 RepID=A0A5N6NGU9_9ASTR|nr:hypothetical protein E3N88_23806 [Mikania micrantha]
MGQYKRDKLQMFRDKVIAGRDNAQYEDANAMWEAMADNVKRIARETLGMTSRSLGSHRESCWWNDEVQHKVRAKQERFRELVRCTEDAQKESLRTKYKDAKREARKAVSEAKNKAYREMYKRLETKEEEHDMFKIAKSRERRRQDIGVLKFIKSVDGRVMVKENDIRKMWQTYFSDVFNNSHDTEGIDNSTIRGEAKNNFYCRRVTWMRCRDLLRGWEGRKQ